MLHRRVHRAFHRLRVNLPLTLPLALALAQPFALPADAQRSWGDADTLVRGPAAAAPSRPGDGPASATPFNPAWAAASSAAVGAGVAVPMGVRELSIHQASGRLPVHRSVVSIMAGRLGFDRLVQHRLSLSIAFARHASRNPKRSGPSAGFRLTVDRFSSPGHPAVHEATMTGGALVSWSDGARSGVVVNLGPGGVAGAHAADISTGSVISLGRMAFASIGLTHSTSASPEFASAVRIDLVPALALIVSLGSGTAGPGAAANLKHSALRIRLAWLHSGPAGGTRHISAFIEGESGRGL